MGIQRNEYQTDGIIINWMHANYRTAWQASEQEKSYLINNKTPATATRR